MAIFKMMQGDQYGIPFTFTDDDGQLITVEDLDDVEIVLGKLNKRYSQNEIAYDEGTFIFPISQDESFSLGRFVGGQVRLKFKSGNVIGEDLGTIDVLASRSKERL